MRGVEHDTLLQDYVLESHQRHDMDALATRFLGATGLLSYTDVAGKGASSIPFDQVEVQRATDYSAEDADVTLQLHAALLPRIESEGKLKFVYESIEMPVSGVLLTMERNGVLIDMQLLAKQGGELGQKMVDLEQKAYELAGGPFNMGSPSSSRKCSSIASSSRSSRRRHRARRPPTRRCWRSSPSIIRSR